MRLIDEFVKKALTETTSFSINYKQDENHTKNFIFMQANMGKARYIYGTHSFNDETFFTSVSHIEPKLTAIVSEGIVYIVDEFSLNATDFHLQKSNNPHLPEFCKYFDSVVEEKKEYFINNLFPAYLDSLEVDKITDDSQKEALKKHARRGLLSKNPEEWLSINVPKDIIKPNDIAKMLCGILNFEDAMKERLNERRDYWKVQKSQKIYINEVVEKKEGIEEWEIALASILRNHTTKYATVHFIYNGIPASGKMEPSTIINALDREGNFNYYDFDTVKNGKEILMCTGCGNKLKCEHIVKITYGKQTLYEKMI